MSLLKTKVQPKLDGKHTATITSYKEVKNSNGGYIEVVFDLDNGRDFKYNIFPKSIQYHTNGIAYQIDSELTDFRAVLEAGRKAEFNIWLSYNKQYSNYDISYYEPVYYEPVATNLEEVQV